MYSNLPLPKLLEIISRIVNDSGCTVRIVDEIPVQDREIRELCLQIYELRRAAQSIAHGELGVHFENCGCMATYLKDIMDRLKAVERGIKELAEGDTPELPRLGALGTYFELIGNTLQENRRLIEKYRNLSLTDMLTGLPNRRGFLALAEKSFARASRKRQSISFIMADIDHFKKVNDRHGHEAGDEVLRVVAQRFLDCLRVEDICCRYGGEEFLVMLYDTDVIRGIGCGTAAQEHRGKTDLHQRGGDPGGDQPRGDGNRRCRLRRNAEMSCGNTAGCAGVRRVSLQSQESGQEQGRRQPA